MMNSITFVGVVLLLWLSFFAADAQVLFNGRSRVCGTSSECQEFRKCQETTKARNVRLRPCRFHRGKFYVCCPKISEPIQDATIVQPPDTNFNCGRRGSIPISFGFSSSVLRQKRSSQVSSLGKLKNSPTVVGGVQSFKNSWPWMVLLARKRGPSNLYFCSGVLINPHYVLTAAHCVLDPEPFFVRLGEHDHSVPKDSISTTPPEDIDIIDVKFHPKYDLSKGYFDVALLKLKRPIQFRKEIGPVCLPWGETATRDLVGERVTITGWGTTQFGGRPSPVLREVEVSVFDPSVCHRSYSTLRDFKQIFPDGMKKNNIVCAGDPEGGKDACQGDSGGPLVHQSLGSKFTLAGIISKGYGCGKKGFPGLFAPLRHRETLQWIKDVAF